MDTSRTTHRLAIKVLLAPSYCLYLPIKFLGSNPSYSTSIRTFIQAIHPTKCLLDSHNLFSPILTRVFKSNRQAIAKRNAVSRRPPGPGICSANTERQIGRRGLGMCPNKERKPPGGLPFDEYKIIKR